MPLSTLSQDFLRAFGIYITSTKNEARLRLIEDKWRQLSPISKAVSYLSSENIVSLSPWFPHSQSQYGQDILLLAATRAMKNGFFVEFGASDGVKLSNTYLLERYFGWQGICSEPSRYWAAELMSNRKCAIDSRCVSTTSGNSILFHDCISDPFFSSVKSVSQSDFSYQVETVSLVDLLAFHNAPSFIDFISVDVEGHEYDILSSFDFSRYKFGIIVVESNSDQERDRLRKLLIRNEYQLFLSDPLLPDEWFTAPGYAFAL